ncbi:methyltransferase LaeA [Xylariomycetidae sp. FL2044]|nr:methyltransferase LaeA [Xylariomycetidae sp. FL2044]
MSKFPAMAHDGGGNGQNVNHTGSHSSRHPDNPILSQDGTPLTYIENGRHYDTFRPKKYMLPVDEEEMDRMDLFNKFFEVARRHDDNFENLMQRRPRNLQPRILDLGCGTGVWAINVADWYRHNLGSHAQVIGWDIHTCQPASIPAKVQFERRDIEEPWYGVEKDSFDLINMRMLGGSVEDWNALYIKIFNHLKPGDGLLEHVEIDFFPHCEDGELPPDSKLRLWARELFTAFDRAHRSLRTANPNVVEDLRRIGFTDVVQERRPIAFNPWPDEEHKKEMARWFNLGLGRGLEALTFAPLTRMNGYTLEQCKQLIAPVRKEMSDRKVRAFCIMTIISARRPSTTPGPPGRA